MENEYTEIKFGFVSAIDSKKLMARVYFPDIEITSAWLPMLVPCSKDNRFEYMPDINEHVTCLICGNTGVVLGSIYDYENKPDIGDSEIWRMKFKDDTEMQYDRKNHILDITDSYGNTITMDKSGITIKSSKKFMIDAAGDMSVNAGGSADISSGSSMKISGSRIDLN